jgi:hypothetical protein
MVQVASLRALGALRTAASTRGSEERKLGGKEMAASGRRLRAEDKVDRACELHRPNLEEGAVARASEEQQGWRSGMWGGEHGATKHHWIGMEQTSVGGRRGGRIRMWQFAD